MDFDFNPLFAAACFKRSSEKIKAVWKTKINQGGFIFIPNGRLKGFPLRGGGGGVFSKRFRKSSMPPSSGRRRWTGCR